jgi:hypothetical protein
MDLLGINFDHDESINDAHAAILNSVNSWGNLLVMLYLIISFEWVRGV